jgi:DNA-binding GntR family transcriptional regulator
MTQEDIIRMALAANILEPVELLKSNQWRQDTIRELERFAALVAAAEREACAKVCEDHFSSDGDWCAAAIRARGQEIDPNKWAFDNGLEST